MRNENVLRPDQLPPPNANVHIFRLFQYSRFPRRGTEAIANPDLLTCGRNGQSRDPCSSQNRMRFSEPPTDGRSSLVIRRIRKRLRI